MLIEAEDSVLVIVDVQARLAPAVDEAAPCLRACRLLARAAGRLDVPIVVTEHCPEKIGGTVREIRDVLTNAAVIGKRRFAAGDEPAVRRHLNETLRGRRTWVVAGMEAHVCVLQTALGLLRDAGRGDGGRVAVVADAVASRRPEDRALALDRLRQAGAVVISAEMAVFEWLRSADHPAFRDLLEHIR